MHLSNAQSVRRCIGTAPQSSAFGLFLKKKEKREMKNMLCIFTLNSLKIKKKKKKKSLKKRNFFLKKRVKPNCCMLICNYVKSEQVIDCKILQFFSVTCQKPLGFVTSFYLSSFLVISINLL